MLNPHFPVINKKTGAKTWVAHRIRRFILDFITRGRCCFHGIIVITNRLLLSLHVNNFLLNAGYVLVTVNRNWGGKIWKLEEDLPSLSQRGALYWEYAPAFRLQQEVYKCISC